MEIFFFYMKTRKTFEYALLLNKLSMRRKSGKKYQSLFRKKKKKEGKLRGKEFYQFE